MCIFFCIYTDCGHALFTHMIRSFDFVCAKYGCDVAVLIVIRLFVVSLDFFDSAFSLARDDSKRIPFCQ